MIFKNIYTILYILTFVKGILVQEEQTCSEQFNTEQCLIDISCDGVFKLKFGNTNYYITTNYDQNYYNYYQESAVKENCYKIITNDDYNGNVQKYYPIHLKYKDFYYESEPERMLPKRKYNYDESVFHDMINLITYFDLRYNNYTDMPSLLEMKNLNVINLSHNNLKIAKLTNKNNLPTLTEIDLSHNSINVIKNNQNEYKFTTIIKVNLSYNQLTVIPESVFESLKDLEILDLSHNFISTLNQISFEGTKKMTHLNLSFNKISDLNLSLFRFSELKKLDLSFNELTNIIVNDFNTLTKVDTLDLSNNLITNIDKDTFGHMIFLESLNLNNNSLHNLDKAIFNNISQLFDIDISKNNFKTIPKGMFRNKNVHNFSIADNQLEGSLDMNMFDGLTFVLKLNLSNQFLEFVGEDAFFGLNNVEEISLNNNNITVLAPKSFRMLQTLRKLDLSFNQIGNLDFVKSDLYNLRYLYLRNNNITVVKQENFGNLNALQVLDLSDNKIRQVETNSFLSLKELIHLEISNNPLSGVLEENTFDGLNSLPSLDISCTSLMSIENSSFNDMVQLKKLNVSHGHINMIAYNVFINTGNIEIVDLSYNNLEEFRINSTDLSKVEILFLNNNHIKILNADTFKVLGKLTVFSVSHNLVENIESTTFSNKTYFRDFDLSYNPLNVTTSLLNEVKIVDSLDLSGITTSVISFENIKDVSVTQLKISNSSVSDVTKLHLNELRLLSSLILNNNDISQLENKGLSNINALRYLDLSHNKISYIKPGAFQDNTLLYALNVSHNLLNEVTYGIFHGLTYLHTLDISFNNIHDLDNERFYEATGLRVIIADQNKIETISPEEFFGMNLNSLSIGDNPMPCDVLVNLKRNVPFHVTARRLDFANNYNVHGTSCARKSDLSNISSNVSFSTSADSTKVLLSIRDILMNRFNNNQESDVSASDRHVLDNINNNIEKQNAINANFNTKLERIINSTTQNTSKPQLSDDTVLLQKMLKVITLMSARLAPTVDIVKGNATNEKLVTYINKIKQDMEASLAFEKDGILDEMRNKMSVLKAQYDLLVSHATDAPKHEKQIFNDSKSYFTETCVGLILLILVCFVLLVVYKSRIGARQTFSVSTRELPGAMDSSL